MWFKWIMEGLRTTSVSIMVNGSPTSEFRMERGLRRGEGSSCTFLIHSGSRGLYSGCKVGEGNVKVNILLLQMILYL